MNELWARVALVAGALAVAGVVALIARQRAAARVRSVKTRGMDAGVYFFSAETCATCEQARAKLDSSLGANGYEELAWEDHPEVFTEYGVDRVPAVMIVDEGGRGRLYFGQPDLALGP